MNNNGRKIFNKSLVIFVISGVINNVFFFFTFSADNRFFALKPSAAEWWGECALFIIRILIGTVFKSLGSRWEQKQKDLYRQNGKKKCHSISTLSSSRPRGTDYRESRVRSRPQALHARWTEVVRGSKQHSFSLFFFFYKNIPGTTPWNSSYGRK